LVEQNESEIHATLTVVQETNVAHKFKRNHDEKEGEEEE
jgi:hypothetical protein